MVPVVRAHCTVQVSLKSSAKPGRNGANIKSQDFKYSRNEYWITSRQSPDVAWMESFTPSSAQVKAFLVRDKSEYDDQKYLDRSD